MQGLQFGEVDAVGWVLVAEFELGFAQVVGVEVGRWWLFDDHYGESLEFGKA